MSACGLDFGTSNTTFGSMIDDVPSLLPLEPGETTIPSAIFYRARRRGSDRPPGDRRICGRRRRPPDAKPEVGSRHVADRRDHAGRTRTPQLSRRDRLLSRRGETAGGAGRRPRIPQCRSWPSGAFRRQCARRPTGRPKRPCVPSCARSASTTSRSSSSRSRRRWTMSGRSPGRRSR